MWKVLPSSCSSLGSFLFILLILIWFHSCKLVTMFFSSSLVEPFCMIPICMTVESRFSSIDLAVKLILVYLFFLLNTDVNKAINCCRLIRQLTLLTCASVLLILFISVFWTKYHTYFFRCKVSASRILASISSLLPEFFQKLFRMLLIQKTFPGRVK